MTMAYGYGSPMVDFIGPLSRIGQQLQQQSQFARRNEILGQSGALGNVPPEARALLLAGDSDTAMSLIRLAEARANSARAQSNADRSFQLQQDEARRAQANADRTFAENQRQFNEGKEKTVDAQVAARQAAAAKLGLSPDSPAYTSFVLTGKMPREDQAPLSATDKKAILEADEMVVSNQSAIDSLKKAKELSPGALTGPGASSLGYVTGLFGSESGQQTTELHNVVTTNALASLKSIFGAAPTEGERKILLEIQGSVNLPDQVRQKIYDRAITMAERRLRFNQERANSLRGGTFYKPGGGTQPAPAAPAASAAPLPPLPPGFVVQQ